MKRVLVFGCCVALYAAFLPPEVAGQKKTDVPALIKALKSKDWKARVSAAEDIGDVGAVRASDTKEAVPILLEMVKKDKDVAVRAAAAKALGRIDPDPAEAVPVLTDALKDKAPSVRTAAADALGTLGEGAKGAVPALQELAKKDKDKGVSRSAKMALKSIRSKN